MITYDTVHQAYQLCSMAGQAHFLYGLADHAGMPGLAKRLNLTHAQWSSLFDGSQEGKTLSVAPLLFQIECDQYGVMNRSLINWLGEQGTYSSSLLLLASPLPLQELTRRLAVRLDAMLPDEMNIMLRYFDPRVFEQLVQALLDEQRRTFLSVAQQWWFVDRRGQLQGVASEFSEVDVFEAPLKLNATQESALIDASEPDQVASLLHSTVPEEYANLPRPERHDFILRHMAAARLLNVQVTHELALYCALALLHGENFATLKPWHVELQRVQTGELSLSQAAELVEQNHPIP
jgi:hypothetical protein